MTTTSYVRSGNNVRVYDSSVTMHDELPVGTYRVDFSPMAGFSLQIIDNLVVNEKAYGGRAGKVDKVFAAFERADRSLGVMLSGSKGQGKSMMLRSLAVRAIASDLPVVMVSTGYAGVAEFLDTLGPCLVLIDEFEKLFDISAPDGNEQDQFLPLLDGISQVKRLYCVSLNETRRVSDYLINRPGRFHYHMTFAHPGAEDIRDYFRDKAPDLAPEQIEEVVQFSRRTPLAYDHLRALAFEMADGASLRDVIEDMNIKNVESIKRTYEGLDAEGRVLWSDEDSADVLDVSQESIVLHLYTSAGAFDVAVTPQKVLFDDAGVTILDANAFSIVDGVEEAGPVVALRIRQMPVAASHAFTF